MIERKFGYADRILVSRHSYDDAAFWTCLGGPAGFLLFQEFGIEPTWIGFPVGFGAAFLAIGALVAWRSS